MLKKTTINKKTNSITYSRGLDLYRANRVQQFSVEKVGNTDYIRAKVKGSGLNLYGVNAAYNSLTDTISSTDCECPAYSTYSGICKHCVAVLLEYVDDAKRNTTIINIEQRKKMNPVSRQEIRTLPPIWQNQEQATSPAIKQLLSNRIMKKTLPLIQDSTYGKVNLEPLFYFDTNSIQVEFKIGVSHMYVLKDIFEFSSSFEKNINTYYGQKLQFVHTLEAFNEKSRPLVQFIRKWVQNNKSKYMQKTYHGYSYGFTLSRLREIPLTGGEMEEFISALNDKTLMANINGTGEKSWLLTEEELPWEMLIARKGKGVEVKINYFSGYMGTSENIYFHEGKIYRIEHSKIEPILDFLRCMDGIPTRTVYIQKEDVPTFCRELLPVLEKFFACNKDNFDESVYGVVPVTFEIYMDAPQKDLITCKIMSVYGVKKFNIYEESEDLIRDQIKEIEVGKVVSSFCNAYDEIEKLMVAGQDEEVIYELLVNGIPRMQELGDLFVSDALKHFNIISSPKVAVGISVTGERMELSMTSEDMSKEQLLEILTKYNRKKKFYRLKNGDFVNVEGEDIGALLELKQGLHLTEAQLKQDVIEVPKYRALYLDAQLKEINSLPVIKDKAFKALVRNMKTIEDNDFDIPQSLENILREYQKRGYLWIKTLQHNGFGGILADDMGLGKTLQVICFLLSEYLESGSMDNRRTLIVCPASLIYNWESEINKFAPLLPVKVLAGSLQDRKELIKNAGIKDILITSYDLLKRDLEYYKKLTLYCEIIDEAQFIKNHNTQVAKAVKTVTAGFKLALTGTPIENRLSELWSIFDYLMSGFLYTYQRFREDLEIPIVQNQDEVAMKRLQKMITPFVLRRLKKDVLTDLPDKLEESVYAKMEGEQQKIYDANVKKLLMILNKQTNEEFKTSKIQILAELTKLRQICCDPALLFEGYQENSAKTELCMEMITNAVSGGHKILLFSQFTSMLDNIQKRLVKEDISFYMLTGSTSKENRAKLVEQFNHDSTSVFCISLKAGGTGLNLTAADIVIHYDPWWNLAVQNQATDRAHRIGQKNVVSVYKLIIKGTIEENIMKIQDKKKELADQVFGGEGIGAGSFSREDLLELLN